MTYQSDKPSRAKQSFKEECDVNNIVKKYALTGYLEHVAQGAPNYGDFTVVTDYAAALTQVRQAEESFMMLPARIRDRFGNDPAAFVAFMEDPANGKAIIDMGLGTRSKSDRPADQQGAGEQEAMTEGATKSPVGT